MASWRMDAMHLANGGAKDGESPFINRSSIPTKLASKTRSLEKNKDKNKNAGIYVKREQSMRTRTPPVIQRRCSLQGSLRYNITHNKAEKAEHPLAKLSHSHWYTEDYEQQDGGAVQRTKKTSLAGMLGEELALNDTSPGNSPNNTLTAADSKTLRGRSGSRLSSIFSPFSREKDKQELLTEKLNEYSLNGLPDMPELLTIGRPQFDESLFELEGHWTAFVDNPGNLTKKQKEQQEALWELLHTEVEYIKSLKVISDLFMCVLINLQNEQLLNEIETEKLFSNISEIAVVNSQFWCDYMSHVLTHARSNRQPMNPVLMKEGFVKKFEEIFHPYTKYCLDHKVCQDYMKTRYRDNELFRTFVVWAEAQKQCNRLKLNDLLVKPMQRLTKYSLLLRAVLKKTEDEQARGDLKEMIESVDKFVSSVDATLRQRHEQERLQSIISRIESYDAVDAPNEECVRALQEYSNFNLMCPMPGCLPQQTRHLILERPIKIKDANSKMDVHCFLFTDMLLITKPTKGRNDKVKVVKPPLRVDKIVVQELRDAGSFLLIYLNEYHVASAAYTMHTDIVGLWIKKIKKAQELYKKARDEATMRAEQHYTSLLDIDEEDDVEYRGPLLNQVNMRNSVSQENLARVASADDIESKFLPNLNVPDGNPGLYHAHSDLNLDQIEMISNSREFGSNCEDSVDNVRQRPRSLQFEVPVSPSLLQGADEQTMQFLFPDGNVNDKSPRSSPTAVRRRAPVQSKPGPIIIKPYRADSSSSETNSPRPQMSPADKKQFALPSKPTIQFNLDDSLRGKLNQRRQSRGEKRYHTADAIQDIKGSQDRDASIHKRLSWNYGTVDIDIQEKQGILKNKTFSSDSLRSIRSSSGVSSTGSLHLSPESEISEEYEQELEASQNNEEPKLRHSESDSKVKPSTKYTKDRKFKSNSNPNKEYSHISNRQNSSQSLGISHLKSKSMSDISSILADISRGEVEDGISSVDLPKVDNNQRRKLSHAEIVKMKKQLLLNSNVEASEV